jgi:hypothetical protein
LIVDEAAIAREELEAEQRRYQRDWRESEARKEFVKGCSWLA